MASQTPNYNLNKIDLTDAPPDITVLNSNFDTIDTQLKTLSDATSGTLPVSRGGTGQTTLTPSVSTKGVRQIYAGTSDMTAGSSTLTTGCVYFVYE